MSKKSIEGLKISEANDLTKQKERENASKKTLLLKKSIQRVEDQETRKRYNELLEEIELAIENITDAKSANEFAKAIATTEIIWDSKVRARELFKGKVEQLQLKWNAKTKTYEDAAA